MKAQSSIEKAFAINNKTNIYGTFAEIGAGQETVNFFYKAGRASQTVAKSMSAYDMTVSDEIYGKQSRYVSKERLMTMLNREYHLLERRLKKSIGKKTCFFAFATTAAVSTKKNKSRFSNNQHAWMGFRFQAQPQKAFNDIVFHVNCQDKSRLQQYEALGRLGVNLIYAGFHYRNNPKKLISSLSDNLSGLRVDIHGLSLTGPAFKNISPLLINLETLYQNLSSMVFFPNSQSSEFLLDAVFGKNILILYEDSEITKMFKRNRTRWLKKLSLNSNQTVVIYFVPKSKSKNLKNQMSHLCKDKTAVLVSSDKSLADLKKRISSYTNKTIHFIVSEDYFTKKMFNPRLHKNQSLLQSLAEIFNNKTKLAVLSKNKNFSLQTKKGNQNQDQTLKNYLISKKQILNIKT